MLVYLPARVLLNKWMNVKWREGVTQTDPNQTTATFTHTASRAPVWYKSKLLATLNCGGETVKGRTGGGEGVSTTRVHVYLSVCPFLAHYQVSMSADSCLYLSYFRYLFTRLPTSIRAR